MQKYHVNSDINRLEAIMMLLDIDELEAHRRMAISVNDVIGELAELTGITSRLWSQHAKRNLSPIMTLKVLLTKANMDIEKLEEKLEKSKDA